MSESFTTIRNFGPYSYGFGYCPETGVSRALIQRNSFVPSSLFAGLEQGAVYDFTDRSQMFQNSTGTTAVTDPGQPIGKVLDLSGCANHLTQTTAGSRALYQGYADFDGVDDMLKTPSNIDMSATDKATLIMSARVKGITGQVLANFGISAAGSLRLSTNAAAPPRLLVQCVGASGTSTMIQTTGDAADTVNRVLTCQFDLAAATAALENILMVDNGAVAQTVQAAGPTGGGTWGVTPFFVGSNSADTSPLFGRIYRLILVNRTLTTAELLAGAKWCGQPAGVVISG